MKLTEMIHRSKLLKICLSLFLCLILIFATQISDTLEVHALAIIDDAIFYAIASACLYLGITIATDPEGQQAVSDFFYSCTDSVKEYITYIADNWVEGVNIIWDWEVDSWREFATQVGKYWGNYTSIDGKIIPDTANQAIGFTPDSSFSFNYTNVDNMSYALPYGVLTMYDTVYIYDTAYPNALIPYNDYTKIFSSTQRMSGYKISSDDGLAYYSLSKFSDNQTIRNSTFKSYSVYSADSYSNSYISNHESSDWIVKIYFNLSTRSNTSSVAFFSDGTYSYAAQKASDDTYRFVDICDDTHFYHDLSFDSLQDLSTWFWNRVGMKTSDDSQADVYNPSNNSSVTVNKDVLNSKLDEAASMAADAALSTVISGSEAKLEEMQANPDLVTDITASDVYQSEIPLVESSSALWTTKFPFCLPFDLYNLFTGMSTTAEAPIFNITVLPENSFGFQNEEIIWTIDFSQFDEFVKIIRFFEGAAFIIFLIMTSRKLIGGE